MWSCPLFGSKTQQDSLARTGVTVTNANVSLSSTSTVHEPGDERPVLIFSMFLTTPLCLSVFYPG